MQRMQQQQHVSWLCIAGSSQANNSSSSSSSSAAAFHGS
jgi:hypothetical protein